MALPNSNSFSVTVVLPASGCEMMAKVRRLATSFKISAEAVFMRGFLANMGSFCKVG